MYVGMDSLMALTCRSNLLPLCKVTKKDSNLPRNIVYHCPSINALYNYLTSEGSNVTLEDDTAHLHARLEALMRDLTFDPSRRSVAPADTHNGNGTHNGNSIQNGNGAAYHNSGEGLVVVLTGSTGTFGSQILTAMLRSSNVQLIHCLNRASSDVPISERQKKNMDEPALLDKFGEKVKFWDMDLTKESLGLKPDALVEVRMISSLKNERVCETCACAHHGLC